MICGVLENPEQYKHWPAILRLLETSSSRYGASPWDADQLVWVVIDGSQIVGVFTTNITEDGDAEIVNVAGRRVGEWLELADAYATMWARTAGAARVTTKGRKGWRRLNAALGWETIRQDGDVTYYEKVL